MKNKSLKIVLIQISLIEKLTDFCDKTENENDYKKKRFIEKRYKERKTNKFAK